jgi:hypothetical protein
MMAVLVVVVILLGISPQGDDNKIAELTIVVGMNVLI